MAEIARTPHKICADVVGLRVCAGLEEHLDQGYRIRVGWSMDRVSLVLCMEMKEMTCCSNIRCAQHREVRRTGTPWPPTLSQGTICLSALHLAGNLGLPGATRMKKGLTLSNWGRRQTIAAARMGAFGDVQQRG